MTEKVINSKNYDVPVSARIPEKLRNQLLKKHPNPGDMSKLIKVLLQKYAEGRLFGVKLDSVS